jgi:hypothetical protein
MNYFRSILLSIVLVFGITGQTFAQSAPPRGFFSLFNGKDLTGWKSTGKQEVWGVDAKTGVLYCQGGGGGWLLTDKEFSDFELRLEYKLPPKGNSGVALRAPFKGDPAYSGMELQLIDDEGWPGKLQTWQHTGSIYNVVPAATQANKPIGQWNQMRVVAKGNKVLVELNGTKLVDANLDELKEHYKKHPGLERPSGFVGFQSYNFKVEFRNIYLKPLDQGAGEVEESSHGGRRLGIFTGRLRNLFGWRR